jgi:hypothetical protein
MKPRKESREYWYGRPESLLAQILAETQKKVIKPILKYPENPRDPQYGCQFYCEWEIPLRTST